MQDVYTVITSAMLQVVRDSVIYRKQASGFPAAAGSSTPPDSEQKRIADGGSCCNDAGSDTYSDAAAENVYVLS